MSDHKIIVTHRSLGASDSHRAAFLPGKALYTFNSNLQLSNKPESFERAETLMLAADASFVPDIDDARY